MSRQLPSPATPANTLRWKTERDTIDLCQAGQLANLTEGVARNVASEVNAVYKVNDGAPRRRVDLSVTLTIGEWSMPRTETLENVSVSMPGLPDVITKVDELARALNAKALEADKIGTHAVTVSVSVEVYNS